MLSSRNYDVGARGMFFIGMLIPLTTAGILKIGLLESLNNYKFAKIIVGGLIGVLVSVGTYKLLGKIVNKYRIRLM